MVCEAFIVALLLGLPVGLALGLTGGGGSLLAVPSLMGVMGYAPDQAVPLSLLVVALSSALGSVWVLQARQVAVRPVLVFAAFGLATAPLGLQLSTWLPPALFVLVFGLVSLLVAALMWRQVGGAEVVPPRASAGLDTSAAVCRLRDDGQLRFTAPCAAVLALAGAATGLLTGVLGVGGGFVIVPMLIAVTQLGIHRAVASSLLIITVIGFGGAVSAAVSGQLVLEPMTAGFIAGGLGGMVGGRLLAPRLPGPWLQRGFAVAIGIVGVYMIWQRLNGGFA